MNEKLVFHIGEQVQELKKLVQVNKNILVILRGSLDQPAEMKKTTSQLTDVQVLLQVCTVGRYFMKDNINLLLFIFIKSYNLLKCI